MKPEEAIRELSCMREGARNHGYKGKEYWFKWIAGEGFSVITIAIQALEKQIPKKVTFMSEYLCGNCDVTINSEDCYCYNCGQRIDWSVEE